MMSLWFRLYLLLGVVLLTACGPLPRQEDPGTGLAVSGEGAYRLPPDAYSRFQHGLGAMEAQLWDEALPAMESLWQDYPWLSGPALNAALIHRHKGREDAAERWFQRALESNTDNVQARNEYAVFLRSRGRYQDGPHVADV